ncbi:DUF1801 domain-containing protein [Candidatus Dojkabacteria bacterium]|nr:DUF1801 domain-containing protein [Candidatus Dojkabacteria bacterium]
MNKEVTEYIKKQKSPQKEISLKLRKIILKTFPDIKEEMKNGVPWYEGKYYIAALRDSVNLGFSVLGLTKKEQKLFKGNGKYMRHRKFRSMGELDEDEIVKLLKIAKKSYCDEKCL